MANILVTGASGGIGAAICHALARRGVTVLLHYRSNRAAAEATRAALGGGGHSLRPRTPFLLRGARDGGAGSRPDRQRLLPGCPPEEVAQVVSYCALDAPPSMTGAILDVNGASYLRS